MAIITAPHPTASGQRFGYTVGALVNVAMLYAVNVWPGWDAVPFLTGDTRQVIGWVNASILAGIVANIGYILWDPRWLKAIGDVATGAVGLIAMVRMWQVFPFDFGSSGFDWALLARVALIVGIVGTTIAVVAALARFVRAVTS